MAAVITRVKRENARSCVCGHAAFSARTDTDKLVYELHDRELRARPDTALPGPEYVHWHTTQVFKGLALTA